MTVEDRLRAAARARAELVRDIRPLDLPASAPARLRGTSPGRRWVAWAAPAAAAAVVVAVAISLVALRQARNDPAAPAPQSSAAAALVGGIPEYYAALDPSLPSGPTTVLVGKVGAAKALAALSAPRGQSFVGVTGAADDRTFVVAATSYSVKKAPYSGAPVAWYLLRVRPAAGPPARLSRLGIPGQPAGTQVSGIALSPDGGKLAVLFQRNVWSGKKGPLTLTVYAVSTGRPVRSWTQPAAGPTVGFGWYSGQYANTSVSWLDGNTLAFDEGVYEGVLAHGLKPPFGSELDSSFSAVKIRTLRLASPGGSLLADSRVVFTARGSSCDTLQLTANRKSVFCGTQRGSATAGRANDPQIIEYTVATGASRVVYRRAGVYNIGVADVDWLNADGSSVLGSVVDLITLGDRGATGFVDAGMIAKGALKPIIFPTNGPPFAGEIAF